MTNFASEEDYLVDGLINQLVGTKHVYEVAGLLNKVPDGRMADVVAAALYRSKNVGLSEGRDREKRRVREVLGL